MLECFSQLLLIEVPELDRVVEGARHQVVVEHVDAETGDFFAVELSPVCLELVSVVTALDVELLDTTVFVAENSEITALTHTY